MIRYAERILKKLFDIREGETVRAVLMLSYIFLIISSLLIVKPVATSLFLSNFGVLQLPNVFILVAVMAAVVFTYYSGMLKRYPLIVLIKRTLITSISSLLLFWALIFFNYLEGWALYLFFIWVSIYAVISTSQFWIFANLIFNPREAKRLFGFIGAGAIAGGIFGGYLTNFLAPVIGSENLILISVLFISLCIPITNAVWTKNVRDEKKKFRQQKQISRGADHPLKLIKDSRHLSLLAGIIGISVLIAKLVEYQFNAVASAKISNSDELTAFFGFWLSNLNIISLLVQLFATRRIVGVFGVGTSLFFLPVGILLGAGAILIHPALWSAILIKISDGSLKQSINKAGIELLALPIPVEIKNQVKSFIDVIVDSFATGLGGILLIFLTLILGLSVQFISLIIILMISGWIYLIIKIRQEYINSFRLKIENMKNETVKVPLDLKNESVYGGLIKVLESGTEKQILKILKMAKEVKNDVFIPSFKKLIKHPSTEIKLETLRNIYFYRTQDFIRDVEELVCDPNWEIKTEALQYLFRHLLEERIEIISQYLKHEDYEISGAALLCAARESSTNIELKNIFEIERRINEAAALIQGLEGKERLYSKINCARVIGAANILSVQSHLKEFFKDESPEVVNAAILAAGASLNQQFISELIRLLGDKKYRDNADIALSGFGTDIIDTLIMHMNDPNEEKDIRNNIPDVVSSIGVQKSINVLLENLEHTDPIIRHEIIKALNKLRKNYPSLRFSEKKVLKRIMDEAKLYLNTLTVLYVELNSETELNKRPFDSARMEKVREARQSLVKTLEHRLDNNLERIFRLLGLKYPPDDMYSVYKGIQSKKPDLRINAIEFLDNVLEPDLKKLIIPIAEAALTDAIISETIQNLDLVIPSEFECIVMLLNGDDSRLIIDALHLISHLREGRYLPIIKELEKSPNLSVRRTVKTVVDILTAT